MRVTTNLGSIDACEHAAVIAALADSVGFDPVPLRKALVPKGGREPDPRFMALETLIRRASRDWSAWGKWLVERVEGILGDTRHLPLSATDEAQLREVMRAHRVGIVGRFSGDYTEDGRRVHIAVGTPGESPSSVSEPPTVELAYRVGRLVDPAAPPPPRAEVPSVRDVIRDALGVNLTPAEHASLDYVRRRGAVFMRRPASNSSSEVDRILTEAEYATVRSAIGAGVENRWSATRTARELRDAITSASLTNEADRVARTELAAAHAAGAYAALKARVAATGERDPEVYKLTRPGACHDCVRIWGHAGSPIRYPLSLIEAREALGGNFRMPREQWGPTIGPTHPNCTEGPLLYYHPAIAVAVDAAMDDYYKFFGRT